jgi:ABC-type phosphate transport system substrate-binding protein
MKPLLIALLTLFAVPAGAELAVVVHRQSALSALTPRQAQDLFLGRTRMLPNNHAATPIDQASPLRGDFYEKLTGRPLEQIDAYWARLTFTGQASPPRRVEDDQAVLQGVRENEDAIGYIDAAHADSSVRILLRLP